MGAPGTATKRLAAAPRRTALARWTGPLVAELAIATRSEPFCAPGWLYELKWDGWRLLAAKDGANITLRLRSGRTTSAFPEIADAVATLPCRRALLDGELVAFGTDGKPDFDLLRERALSAPRSRDPRTDVRVCAFDLLALDDHDLRQLPILDRKERLRDLLADADHRVLYVDHTERGDELLAGARILGLEGVIAKRMGAPYSPGRSESWRKIKIEDTSDFIVLGVAAPSKATFGRRSLILGGIGDHGLRYVGRVAVGARELDALEVVAPQLRRAKPTCACRGVGRVEVWFEPAIVCEVRQLAAGGSA